MSKNLENSRLIQSRYYNVFYLNCGIGYTCIPIQLCHEYLA